MRKCDYNRNKKGTVLFITLAILSMVIILYSSPAQALSKNDWLWPIPEHKHMSRGYYSSHKAIDIDAGYGTPVRAAKDGFVIRIYTGCTGNYNSYASCTRTTCAPTVYENFGAYSSTDYRTYDGGIYGFEEKDSQGNIIHSWSRCNGGYGIGLLIYHPEDDSVSSYAHFSRLNPDLDLIEKIKTGTAKVKQGDIIGYVGASGNAFGAHLHFQIGYSYGNWVNNNPNSPSLGIISNKKTGLTTSSDGYSYNTDGVSYIFDYNFNPQVSLIVKSGVNSGDNTVSPGTKVDFEFVSNCTQGVNGCYFDMYVWKKEDYGQGKTGIWAGVSGTNASYTFNETGEFYVCARIHNTSFDIYSEPVIIRVINANAPTQVQMQPDGDYFINRDNSIIFTFGADKTCQYQMHIWKDNAEYEVFPVTSPYEYKFIEPGTYSVWITAYNDAGSIDSNSIAVFVRNEYYLYTRSEIPGRFSPTSLGNVVEAGTTVSVADHPVTLSEEDNQKYEFDHWESDCGDIFVDAYDENTTFTMPESDCTIIKVFRNKDSAYINLTIAATPGGTASVSVDGTIYEAPATISLFMGERVTIDAFEDAFYEFVGWETDGSWIDQPDQPVLWDIPLPDHDTTVRAVFAPGPYVMDETRAFHLPAGLQEIEEEAFAGVAARYFVVPDSVTSIASGAFPANAVVYLPIGNMTQLPLDAIDQTGTYIDTGYGGLAFAKSAEGTAYTVLNNKGKPYYGIWSDWSDWSETPVEASATTQVETMTQYSYRDTTYETRYSDWSSWSGWTTTRQATSDLKREESARMYIWYWFECPSCHHHDPTYGKCGACGAATKSTNYSVALWPIEKNGSGTYASGNRRAYNDPAYGTAWYNDDDNANQVYTGYRYSTRSTYQQAVVSEWSEYSESVPAEQAGREIRTRILYRYRTVAP